MAVQSTTRPCNQGPCPPVNEDALTASLQSYVDNTSRDAELFEWGLLASATKGGGLPYHSLAEHPSLVIAHMQALPAARVTESTIKRVYHRILGKNSHRAIFPKTPRTELVAVLYRAVSRCEFNLWKKTFVFQYATHFCV